MIRPAHKPVRPVRKRTEIFQVFLKEKSVLILLKFLAQVHDLIIVAAKVQKFPSDRHELVLEIRDMLLAHIFFHPEKAPLIRHQHLQITADKFRNIIIKKTFFRLSLMSSLLLDPADQPDRKIFIVHNHHICPVHKEIHPVPAPQNIQKFRDAQRAHHTILLIFQTAEADLGHMDLVLIDNARF